MTKVSRFDMNIPKTEYSEFYEDWGTRNVNSQMRSMDAAWKASIILKQLLSVRKINSNTRLIDFGGADGVLFDHIRAGLDNNRITGPDKSKFIVIDISEHMINTAIEKGYIGIRSDHLDFSEKSHAEDILILCDILEHLPDVSMTLDSIKRHYHTVVIKLPIEECFFNSNFYYFLKYRKVRKSKYGLLHQSGHLRGYTLSSGISLISAIGTPLTLSFNPTPLELCYNYSQRKMQYWKIVFRLLPLSIWRYLHGGHLFSVVDIPH